MFQVKLEAYTLIEVKMADSLITYILHHDDADGFGAAAAAFKRLGQGSHVRYIAVDYGRAMPDMEDGSTVYILDYSYPRAVLEELNARMKSVTVIDHHKSAMLDLEGLPYAIFDMNKSGAGLAWDYFNPDEPRPAFINYIEDSDLYKFALPDAKYVRLALFQIELDLEVYVDMLYVDILDLIYDGKTLEKMLIQNLEMGFKTRHVIEVDEYKMLAVNVCLHMSDFGNQLFTKYLAESGADFAGVYYRMDDDKIKFSCRSVGDFDVSLICKRFGGGGHKNASGFEIPVDSFNGRKITSNGSPV